MDDVEIVALAALDDRARRAASSLQAAVAEARDWTSLDLQPPPDEPSGNEAAAEHGGHDPDRLPSSEDDEVVSAGVGGPRKAWRKRAEHGAPDGWPADEGAEVVLQGRGENEEASVSRVRDGDRRRWLAAAAVFAVVVAVGGFLALRDDGSPALQATQPGLSEYLVAGWLPEGWEPLYAALNPRDGDSPVPEGETVAYGDASREDPWTGPVLVAQRYTAHADDWWWAPAPEDVTDITIEGVPVFVEDNGDVITVGTAEPIGGDQYVAVVGYGFDLDVVLEAARHLTMDPAVGQRGLPDGYEEIARGPVAATFMGQMRHPSLDGLAVSYGRPDGEDPQINLAQQPADSPGAAALLRLFSLESGSGFEVDVTQVRGQEAYVLRLSSTTMTEEATGTGTEAETGMRQGDDAEIADGDTAGASTGHDPKDTEVETTTTMVQWYEPSLRTVVGLTALDVDEETLDRFIESLRVAGPQEIEALLEGGGS